MQRQRRSLNFRLSTIAGAAVGFAILTASLPALAQADLQAFRGRTVTYIVATAPGGGFDFYGRLVAEYMQRNLPGSTFVVKNVPGAGHIIGANRSMPPMQTALRSAPSAPG